MVQDLKTRFTPQPLKVLEKKPQVCTARFTPCGKFLVAGGFDGKIHRWDLTAENMPELPAQDGYDGWVSEVGFDHEGKWLFSADSWGQLRCTSLTEPQAVPRWTVPQAHDGWIQSLAISRDGKHVATVGNDHRVCLWSTETGQRVKAWREHTDPVFRVAFHPDNQRLATGDLKGNVKLWNIAQDQSLSTLSAKELFKEDRLQEVGGIRSLAFDGPGLRLAVGGTKPANGGNVQGIPCVFVFDVASGQVQHTLELGASGDVYPCDLAFHPEGFLMMVVSGNPGTGKLIFRHPEEKEPFVNITSMANCHSLSLHPHADRLAVVATNGGSNGNGRSLDKNGEYPDNFSPIHLLQFPKPAA